MDRVDELAEVHCVRSEEGPAPLVIMRLLVNETGKQLLLWLQHPALEDLSGVPAIIEKVLTEAEISQRANTQYASVLEIGRQVNLPKSLLQPELLVVALAALIAEVEGKPQIAPILVEQGRPASYAQVYGGHEQPIAKVAANWREAALALYELPLLDRLTVENQAPLVIFNCPAQMAGGRAVTIGIRYGFSSHRTTLEVQLNEAGAIMSLGVGDEARSEVLLDRLTALLLASSRSESLALGIVLRQLGPAFLEVNVAATFTANAIVDSVAGWLKQVGVWAEVNLLDGGVDAALASTRRGALLVVFSLQDLSKKSRRLRPLSRLQHVPPGIPTTQLPNGWIVAERRRNETMQMYEEIFVEQDYFRHGITLPAGGTFLDVGANIGLFSLYIYACCENATIHAFEPFESVARILEVNASIYGAPIQIHRIALADKDASCDAYFYPDASLQSGLFTNPKEDLEVALEYAQNKLGHHSRSPDLQDMIRKRATAHSLPVETQCLSRVINDLDLRRIDLLKIDAEKSEFLVLNGLDESHWDRIQQLVIEVHNSGTQLQDLAETIRSHGFRVVVEQRSAFIGTPLHMIYAVRENIKGDNYLDSALDNMLELVERSAASGEGPLLAAIRPSEDPFLKSRESLFRNQLDAISGVIVLNPTLPTTRQEIGLADDQLWYEAIGELTAKEVTASLRQPAKVLVVDADETLWGGICGEIGPKGIRVEGPYRKIQEYLVRQSQQGRLLCLSSRNNLTDVLGVFDANPDQPLRLEHFAAIRVDWGQKTDHVLSMADELNIDTSSFVFIDNDVRERTSMRLRCPDITVVELPDSPHDWLDALHRTWILEQRLVTREDLLRTDTYVTNTARSSLRRGAHTYQSFLEDLQLEVIVRPATVRDLTRLTQLAKRSNQFNTTTLRRDYGDYVRLLGGPEYLLAVSVRDRFSDFGIVGLAVLEVRGREAVVQELLLSCRVMGRSVETYVARELARTADSHGCEILLFDIRPTERNFPAREYVKFMAELANSLSAEAIPVKDLINIDWRIAGKSASPPVSMALQASKTRYSWPAPAPRTCPDTRNLRERPRLFVPYQSPRTEMEWEVSQLCKEVIGVNDPGIHDSVQDLGGDSLSALKIKATLIARWGLELPLEYVLYQANIATLAARITQGGGLATQTDPISAEKSWREGQTHVLASPGQARLWAAETLSHYSDQNVPLVYDLSGELNADALERALRDLVKRHHALRTTLLEEEGQVVQILADPIITLSRHQAYSPRAAEVLERRLLTEPFDLKAGALVKAELLQIGPQTHRLVLSVHHSAIDGWSVGLLNRELGWLYSCHCIGDPIVVDPPALQFVDVAAQRNLKDFTSRVTHWAKEVGGLDSHTPLVQARHSHHNTPGSLWKSVEASLFEVVKNYSSKEGVTPFTVYLAAFELALAAGGTGATRALILPFADRGEPGEVDVVGFVANLLVVPALKEQPACLGDHLTQITARLQHTLAEGNVPFGLLAPHIRMPEVVVTQQLRNDSPLLLEEVEVSPREPARWPCPFPLMADFHEKEGGFLLHLRYWTERWTLAEVEALSQRFIRALRLYCIAPLCPMRLAELEIVAERGAQVSGSAKTLIEALLHWASVRADEIAVLGDSGTLTFSELMNRAQRVAAGIRRLGRGGPVALALKRDVGLPIAMIGAALAGRPFVPLDPTHPEERLRELVLASGADVLISEQGRPLTPAASVTIDNLLTSHPGEVELEEVSNIAYILFTSGTTGRPKGVTVTWTALNHYLRSVSPLYCGNGFGSIVHSSPGVDFTITPLLVPLMAGERTWLLLEEGPQALLEALSNSPSLSFLKLTPSNLRLFDAAQLGQAVADSTKTLVLGGEALYGEQLDFLREAAPGLQVVNEYGPTEATVGCCLHVRALSDLGPGPVPIGRPIGKVWARIRNEEGLPAREGELFLGGACLALGYWNDSEATKISWFKESTGELLYRTGDLVRELETGCLVYLGRVDNQLKVQGYRVEPGEVEAVLLSHDKVVECAVLQDPSAGGRLAAMVVSNDEEHPPSPDLLREWLRERLPSYMIPASFTALAMLPVTRAGKCDRARLRTLLNNRPSSDSIDTPSSHMEELMADVWCVVLGVKNIGRGDDFFALGGDSMLALAVSAECYRRGLQLSAYHVFELRTLSAVAAVMEVLPTIPAYPKCSPGHVVLTPNQRAFFALKARDLGHWNLSWEALTPSRLDTSLLRDALERVLLAHPALRTRFNCGDDGWGATLENEGYVGFEHVVLSDVSFMDEVRLRAQHTLDLHRGPLSALVLIDLPTETRLFWTLHHLVADVVSFQILGRDLWEAYDNLYKGGHPELIKVNDIEMPSGDNWSPPPLEAPLFERDMDRIDNTIHLQTPQRATELLPILVAALGQAMCDLHQHPVSKLICEVHGRDLREMDVSRAVGWFTRYLTISVTSGPADVTLVEVQAQLASPRPVVGSNHPAVALNFVGSAAVGQVGAFQTVGLSHSTDRPPEAPRLFPIEIVVEMNTAMELHLRYDYARPKFPQSYIERLHKCVCERLPTFLSPLVERPDESLLGGLPEAEVARILREVNADG